MLMYLFQTSQWKTITIRIGLNSVSELLTGIQESILTQKWWLASAELLSRMPLFSQMSIHVTEISLTTHAHFITHYCLYNIRFSLYIQQKSAVNVDVCIKLWLGVFGDHTDFFHTESKHGKTVGQPSAWQLMRYVWMFLKIDTPPRTWNFSVHLRSFIIKGEKSGLVGIVAPLCLVSLGVLALNWS